jgi:hypothetical protein
MNSILLNGKEIKDCSDEELESGERGVVHGDKVNTRMWNAILREQKLRRRELRDRIRAHLVDMDWRATPTIGQLRAALAALCRDEP